MDRTPARMPPRIGLHVYRTVPGERHPRGTQARALWRPAALNVSPILDFHPGAAADSHLQQLAWRLSQTWRLNQQTATPCSCLTVGAHCGRRDGSSPWLMAGRTAPESGSSPRRQMTWLSERGKAKIPATGVECGLSFRAPRLLNPLERPTNQSARCIIGAVGKFPRPSSPVSLCHNLLDVQSRQFLTGLRPKPHRCHDDVSYGPMATGRPAVRVPEAQFAFQTLWPLNFLQVPQYIVGRDLSTPRVPGSPMHAFGG